jgi:hypothetical protein
MNRMEYSEINPYSYNHLNFDKGTKNIFGKEVASSKNGAEKRRKRLKLDSYL